MPNPTRVLIDDAVIIRLAETALQTAAGGQAALVCIPQGRPWPKSAASKVVAKVLTYRLVRRTRRVNAADEAFADFLLMIEISVPELVAGKSVYAPATGAAQVADVFDQAGFSDAGTTHYLEIDKVDTDYQDAPVADNRIRRAVITITGVARRVSGQSLSDHVA